MGRRTKRLLCGILSFVLIVTGIPGKAFATGDSCSVITGTYSFTSNEESNIQVTDEFTWRDDCFTRSSFLGCDHLRLLSSQAALASASRYGDNPDKYEQDFTNNAQNIKAMLTDMGFSNVESNTWYSKEKQENSCGVTMGERQIIQDGKAYTLLAIIPRSAGYKQEWVGNFNVGTGDIHQGFTLGRDEALRFAKQYMTNHNVSGDLKVWIAGHSRGGAISNLIGGFFAGGGIGYFGDSVSITPEDVYCYTFATPKNVKDGVSKNVSLSVSGARDGVYRYDTPGEAYTYSGGGRDKISDEVYNGIRNYPFAYDLITYLPPSAWGFANYGQYCDYSDVSEADMRNELSSLSPFAYKKYTEGGSPLEFSEKTLDIGTISPKDKAGGKKGQTGMVEFVKERIAAFTKSFPSNKVYVEDGWQEMAGSFIALYGMAEPTLGADESMMSTFIQPMLAAYLAYAYKELKAEGKVNTEGEAAAIAAADLLSTVFQKEIDRNTYKVDEFIADITGFIADHEDEELSQKVIGMIEEVVPVEYKDIARMVLSGFCPGYDSSTPLSKVVFEFIKACARGADPNCAQYASSPDYQNPAKVRTALYGLIGAMSYFGNDTIAALNTAIQGGNGTFSGFVSVLIDILKSNTDPTADPGNPPTPYADLEEAANKEFEKALAAFEKKVFDKIDENHLYTEEFKTQLRSHFAKAKQNVAKLREAAVNLLFGNEGSYDTNRNLDTLATLLGNVGRVPTAHYNELFVAWGEAGARGAQEHSTTDTNDVEPVQVPDTGDRGFIGFLENEWNKLFNVLQTKR